MNDLLTMTYIVYNIVWPSMKYFVRIFALYLKKLYVLMASCIPFSTFPTATLPLGEVGGGRETYVFYPLVQVSGVEFMIRL